MLIPIGFFGGGAAGAYELISTTILSTTATTVTFNTSTLSAYKHLQLRMSVRSAAGDQTYMKFNGVGSGNYSYHELFGSGSSVTSQAWTSQNSMKIGANNTSGSAANAFGALICDILDFNSTIKNTTIKTFSGSYDQFTIVRLNSGAFINTAAVTSIELNQAGGTFAADSRFSLYGIKG